MSARGRFLLILGTALDSFSILGLYKIHAALIFRQFFAAGCRFFSLE